MMVSIKEKIQALEEKALADSQELTALHAACDDYKAENEALKAELGTIKAELESKVVEGSELVDELKAELEAKDVALAESSEKLEEMKAKMELSPVADAVDGQKPVADGSVADVEKVDHLAALAKLAGAEKIAYYRAHAEEIDKAYK